MSAMESPKILVIDDDPMALVQRNADGSPIIHHDSDAKPYGVYYGCLNNPHWRNVLKAFVKRGIDAGVDGFVINYLYRNNCVCEHCQRAFKKHLADRYTPPQLRAEFGIDNLEAHRFTEIVSRHNPQETTPLRCVAVPPCAICFQPTVLCLAFSRPCCSSSARGARQARRRHPPLRSPSSRGSSSRG